VKLLLDTHSVIWWMDQDDLLSRKAHEAISEPENALFISAASVREIGIKVGLGKLELSMDYNEWMTTSLENLQAILLPVTVEYAARQSTLPFHHQDPFDRMIVAQAQVENLTVVSRDEALDPYGINRTW
jgi:PIN domain nuclease of toxin-antitoxin system